STVLGLGWNVAGDLSHAAGNGISQIEETPEWSAEKTYNIGEIVTYKAIRYEARFNNLTGVLKPNRFASWKVLNVPEWSSKKIYWTDDTVTYNGIEYRATDLTLVGEKPGESTLWEVNTQ
ncbi:hypothetical protein CN553_26930, partial [Bacillus cereus]